MSKLVVKQFRSTMELNKFLEREDIEYYDLKINTIGTPGLNGYIQNLYFLIYKIKKVIKEK